MNREEIVQAVQSYIRNENEKYALLINGAWGSGKTFLYENYLCDAISDIEVGKNERKKNVYISLYGISTIETLSKQLMTNYLVYVKANGNEIVKKGAKPVAGFLGIVSKAFSFSIGLFSADFGDVLKDISGLLEAKNMVVCFDDLERCTIPINEFFGYVNNLIEYCNCKVLILADENNIGKVFANTNIEQKYQTILTGDRKVIQDQSEENKKKNNIDKNLITIRQLKELNERLYSENFIYRDIKEKVIGKTCNYYPEIKENLVELISGTDKHKGCVGEGDYKEFLVCHMDAILSAFSEVDNRNLRIIIAWLDMFRGIFVMTNRNMKSSQYYENIISDFLRYSIWAVVSNRKNKKIIKSAYYGNFDYVYFEGHEYTHTIRYYFIDKYIRSDYLDEADLVSSARSIEARCEREKIYNKEQIQSTGVAYSELRNWRYMDDDLIRDGIQRMIVELKENKYAYPVYSNIIELLLLFSKMGLYEGDLSEVQTIMLSLVENDMRVQDENRSPISFRDEDAKHKYLEVYQPIAESRKKRNEILDKGKIEEENIYDNAEAFLQHCHKREEYYCTHKSFMEYIDVEKLIKLINCSKLEGVYKIADAFDTIYYMGNVRDFYMNDIDGLKLLKERLKKVDSKGITRKCAIEYLISKIDKILVGLGVGDENE